MNPVDWVGILWTERDSADKPSTWADWIQFTQSDFATDKMSSTWLISVDPLRLHDLLQDLHLLLSPPRGLPVSRPRHVSVLHLASCIMHSWPCHSLFDWRHPDLFQGTVSLCSPLPFASTVFLLLFSFQVLFCSELKPTCLGTTTWNSHGPFWLPQPIFVCLSSARLSSLFLFLPLSSQLPHFVPCFTFLSSAASFVFCCLFSYDFVPPALPVCLSATIPCQGHRMVIVWWGIPSYLIYHLSL